MHNCQQKCLLFPFVTCSATIDIGQRNKKDWEIGCVQTDNGPEFTTRFVRGLTEKSTLFQTTASKLGIHHKLIKPYTPRHNGKEERIHREAHNKFYSCHSFSSCGDLNQQLKDHLVRSDNRPMRPLGWLSPVEFLSNYRVQNHWQTYNRQKQKPPQSVKLRSGILIS